MNRSALAVLGFAILTSGCFGVDSEIGNVEKTCTAGQSCVCDVLGNCDLHCPGGGCTFRCEGTGNCITDCTSNCTMDCVGGTGNCSLTCSGTGCQSNCLQVGNCTCNQSGGTC